MSGSKSQLARLKELRERRLTRDGNQARKEYAFKIKRRKREVVSEAFHLLVHALVSGLLALIGLHYIGYVDAVYRMLVIEARLLLGLLIVAGALVGVEIFFLTRPLFVYTTKGITKVIAKGKARGKASVGSGAGQGSESDTGDELGGLGVPVRKRSLSDLGSRAGSRASGSDWSSAGGPDFSGVLASASSVQNRRGTRGEPERTLVEVNLLSLLAAPEGEPASEDLKQDDSSGDMPAAFSSVQLAALGLGASEQGGHAAEESERP